MTLREIGEEFGVTRERVRQIERDVERKIERRLSEEPVCAPIVHLAVRLRDRLGTIASDDAAAAALADAVPEGQDAELRRAALLALAGPYSPDGGLWVRGTALADLMASLLERADDPLRESELTTLLRRAGVAPQYHEACVAALPLRRFGGHVLLWSGSAGKKAARVLRARGRPMSRSELSAALGTAQARPFWSRLNEDQDIRRVSLHCYGLPEWDEDEYVTVADELQRAIERRGGPAPLEDLVAELVGRFGVSPGQSAPKREPSGSRNSTAAWLRSRTPRPARWRSAAARQIRASTAAW